MNPATQKPYLLTALLANVITATLTVGTATRMPAGEIVEVRKIWDQPGHQSFFTDLIRYRDQWICTFREDSKQTKSNDTVRSKVSKKQKQRLMEKTSRQCHVCGRRSTGIRETSIACHLRQIKAALNWAVKFGHLAKMPVIDMPKRSKGITTRGRPISEEEFRLLINAVPKVRKKDPGDFQRFLLGLWLSGLRLGEARILSWDKDAPFAVDLTGRHPRFNIYAEAEKAHKDRILPMAPEFAKFILERPEDERQGRVLNLTDVRTGKPLSLECITKIIIKIGKASGVVVYTDKKTGKKKPASAQSLRKSFGTRWAAKVMPATLKVMMRHSSVETTSKYYVGLNADAVADELWAFEKTSTLSSTVGELDRSPVAEVC